MRGTIRLDWFKSLMRALSYQAIFLFAPIFTAALLCVLLREDEPTAAISGLSTLIGYVLTVYILKRWSEKRRINAFEAIFPGNRKLTFGKTLNLFSFGFALGIFISGMLSVLPLPEGELGRYAEQSSGVISGQGPQMILPIFAAVIAAPIAEEILFRGFVLSELSSSINQTAACVIASLMFAVGHGHIYWVIYAFIIGLIFSFVVVRYANVAYTIVMHIGFNATSLLILTLNNNGIILSPVALSVLSVCGLAAACMLFLLFYKRERV